MAKYKIIWSHKSRIKLYEILEFYANRNNSKDYSKKLYRRISKEVNLLSKYPELGINTDLAVVRCLIIDDYLLFYEVSSAAIIIHTLWDSRQDPEKLTIK